MVMNRARGLVVALAAATAVVLAGCQSGGGGAGAASPAPASPASPASSSPGTKSECSNLVASGQALVNTVTGLVHGTSSREQVRSAATDLMNSVTQAQKTVGAQASAQLDMAKSSLQQVINAAKAQPPNVAAMRTGANDMLTALRNAAKFCQSPSTAPSPSG